MNSYAVIILAALLVGFLLDIVSEIMNLRALSPELPEEFKELYGAEEYARSQEYTRVKTRFGFITGIFSLILMLLFWFLGAFNLLDLWVRQLGIGAIWTGLIYIAALVLGKTVISLPFSIYSTFVIEERFGFNRTRPATFVLDLLKGLALAAVLGGPLMAAILAFFQFAGSPAWLYCWLLVTAFMIFMQFVAPTWIMPLFNKFTPLEEGELKGSIMDYARSVNFSLENIFVMDGSKRSSKSNAFFSGFGRHKRIALFDTLIAKHTVAELTAILAHEIGHYQKKHILQGMVIGVLHSGVMFFLLSIFISSQGLFEAFYMENISVYAGLIFFSLLYTPIEMVLSVFMNMLSRKNEYEADRFAVETNQDSENMILALKKLSVHNLANLTPDPFYVFLNYSHPPLLERIRAIRSLG